uniref:Palmitoyltransferase n=1 Tax=Ascaris lumbricoides TaxID=6252 RepID=A0A9J2P740_ASCLU
MILRRDPCGVLCALLTYAAMIYADYVVINWLVAPTFSQSLWGVTHVILFNTILFLAFIAHFRAMVTDPGIVPINTNATIGSCRRLDTRLYGRSAISESENDESDSGADVMMLRPKFVGEDWSICTRCESYRPPRAHHCRVCRRCVRKMDHHCPWVNNCVGEFNQKYFLQFLLYVGLSSSYALGLVVAAWVYHDDQDSAGINGLYGQSARHARILHTIFLSIESALFGLFVSAVSCDQLQAIFNDETAVEAVQRGNNRLEKVGRRSKRALLREVCGTDSVVMWFVPCSSLPSERDVVQFAHTSQFEV